jgi:hypothetical protein
MERSVGICTDDDCQCGVATLERASHVAKVSFSLPVNRFEHRRTSVGGRHTDGVGKMAKPHWSQGLY